MQLNALKKNLIIKMAKRIAETSEPLEKVSDLCQYSLFLSVNYYVPGIG